MTKKQQLEKRRAIIAATIKEKTHKKVSIKLPIATVDLLKSNAKSQGRLFSAYMAESVERGAQL